MLSKDIKYIGVNDHKTDLFEGQFAVPNGISYNSYIILDEKIAVMDTVDAGFTQEWLQNMKTVLLGKEPDYLIVQHMEPDHSANIFEFVNRYPKVILVASDAAFKMMRNFFGMDFADRRLIVREGDTLSLGKHQLTFITASMVHWPEVIVTYDSTDKVLFSADGFGKFGALDVEEDWVSEARRYYFGVVGKYGVPVQALLKKLAALEIAAICPLHGPILSENLEYYIKLYHCWSTYEPEQEGVVIAYTSCYGNTKKAVILLQEKLKEQGYPVVIVHDLARCDKAEAVADAFCYDKLVLATTTYNGAVFPFMREFIHHLTERSYGNRTVALMENGSWAPLAAKRMKALFADAKGLTFAEPTVTILSALDEKSLMQIEMLSQVLCEKKQT